jgi:hypothetical protein
MGMAVGKLETKGLVSEWAAGGSSGGIGWSIGAVLRLRPGGVLLEVVGHLGSHKHTSRHGLWRQSRMIESKQGKSNHRSMATARPTSLSCHPSSQIQQSERHFTDPQPRPSEGCALGPVISINLGERSLPQTRTVRSNIDLAPSDSSRPCMTRKLESRFRNRR